MDNKIQVVQVEGTPAPIFSESLLAYERVFDVSMCNPPFFHSSDEAAVNPQYAWGGRTSEIATTGGEAQFISQMVTESLILRHKIGWYTSLIGRKKTLKDVLRTLRTHNVTNIKTTTFYQGVTTRWGIAWSFSQDLNSSKQNEKVLARKKESKRKNSHIFVTDVPHSVAVQRIQSFLDEEASKEHDSVKKSENTSTGSTLCWETHRQGHMVVRLKQQSQTSLEDAAKRDKVDDGSKECKLTDGITQDNQEQDDFLQFVIKFDSISKECSNYVVQKEHNITKADNAGSQSSTNTLLHVSIVYECGERKYFWLLAEKVVNHVLRKGRRFRRQNKI